MEALKDKPELLDKIYELMKELREDEDAWDNLPQGIKDKVNNFLKDYEKGHDDDIDVDNQEVEDIANKISIEIDEDGVSFKYDDRYISESKFFELADVYQQDYTFSSSFKNLTPEKALKGILINENAMEEWENNPKLCDKVFVITEKKIRSNANIWDKLSKEVKDKVTDYSNEYLNNKDISPEDVEIAIDEKQGFKFENFYLNDNIISTGALLKIAENYKQKNDEYIPDGDDITLSTAVKCILFNENVMENLKSEPGLFDNVFEIVEVFGKNEQALNSLPPEMKDELSEFLEEYDDYNETPRISSKPQKGNSEKNKKSSIVVDDEDDDDYADNSSDFSNDDDDDEPPRVSRKRPQKGEHAQSKKSSESSIDIDDDEPPRINKKRSQRGEQEQSKEISVVNANNDNATVEQTNDTNKKENKKAKTLGKNGNKKRRFKKRPRKKVTSSNVMKSTQNNNDNDDTIIGNDEDAKTSDDVAKDIKSSDDNFAVNNVTSDKDQGDVDIEKNSDNNFNENEDSNSVNANIPKENSENSKNDNINIEINNSDNAEALEDNNNYDHISNNNVNDNVDSNINNSDSGKSYNDNDNNGNDAFPAVIVSPKFKDLIAPIRSTLNNAQRQICDEALMQHKIGTDGHMIYLYEETNAPNKIIIKNVLSSYFNQNSNGSSNLQTLEIPQQIITTKSISTGFGKEDFIPQEIVSLNFKDINLPVNKIIIQSQNIKLEDGCFYNWNALKEIELNPKLQNIEIGFDVASLDSNIVLTIPGSANLKINRFGGCGFEDVIQKGRSVAYYSGDGTIGSFNYSGYPCPTFFKPFVYLNTQIDHLAEALEGISDINNIKNINDESKENLIKDIRELGSQVKVATDNSLWIDGRSASEFDEAKIKLIYKNYKKLQ